MVYNLLEKIFKCYSCYMNKSIKITQIFLQPFCRFFSRYRYKLIIKGVDNLNIKNGFILASNHSSFFDPIILISAIPKKKLPLLFITKKKILKKERLGFILSKNWFIKNLGALMVPDGQCNYGLTLKEPINYLQNNKNVVIFPEGKINKEIKISEARGGLGYLASISKKKVIPVKIKNNKNKIIIIFGSAINISKEKTNNIDYLHYKQLSKKILEKIIALN